MSMFDQPFRKHIIDELTYRRNFRNVQTALHPHVRVTSLVEGNLGMGPFNVDEDLIGFTLGIPDVRQVNTISSYLNTPGASGTAIGLTYPGNGGSKLIKIGTGGKKIPPPGVTDVQISTKSKGGFLFKATVNLKFFGHEQYNFIYQTFLRPGNPILIEYGHTRADDPNGKDLGFFRELSHNRLQEYKDNFKNNKQLKVTQNSGAVVGLVSNFSVRLNEQNEYEATIDLINALEYMFTLSPEDTFLNYGTGKNQLAKSIRANFGIGKDEEWEPKDDKFFKFIIEDSYLGGENSTGWAGTNTSVAEGGTNYGERVILPGEWTREYKGWGEERVHGRSIKGTKVETWEYSSEEGSDYLFVSLDYFLNKLLNQIINESYVESRAGFVSGQFTKVTGTGNYMRAVNDERRVVLPPPAKKQFHCEVLRSVDPKKVIINNSNFYIGTDYFLGARGEAYKKKYNSTDVQEMFNTNDDWEFKEQYNKDSTIGGIFLNYLVIRSAFLSSKSVAEAIQKVLNTVNVSTNGILDLKMKLLPAVLDSSEGETEEFKITIYDEAESVSKSAREMVEDLYTFFEEDVSEAISYDFDFSLPSSVAAGVMASTFQPQEYEISGGDAKSTTFVKYGYALKDPEARPPELAITSLLDSIATSEDLATMEAITYEEMTPLEREAEDKRRAADLEEYNSANSIVQYDELTGAYNVPSPARARIQNSEHWTDKSYIDDQGNMWYSEGNIAAHAIKDEATGQTAQYQYYDMDSNGNITRNEEIEAEQKEWEDTHANQLGAQEASRQGTEEPSETNIKDVEEERLYRKLLGYKELIPPAMKSSALSDGLLTVFPSSAQITIKLQGLDGFRFGDLFLVNNILPHPYDGNSIFMLTGYQHTIGSDGWFTEIDATLIAEAPQGHEPPGSTYRESSGMTDEEFEHYENTQLGEI